MNDVFLTERGIYEAVAGVEAKDASDAPDPEVFQEHVQNPDPYQL